MKDMDDIIKAGIIALGGDGLACSDCGCGIDDLMPCGDFMPDCFLGRRVGEEWIIVDGDDTA